MPFEFVAEKLVYGGDALGHHQGRAVLVPQALPGERLEVEPVRMAKGVLHARPVQILEAAPDRIAPPCPYFGHCGGCHYQHLSPSRQTLWKREILRETLRRIGKIVWDREIRTHAGHPWHYRNQAQLKVARQPNGQVAVGFFGAESHRLFPVDVCLILSPRLNEILKELRSAEWSSRLAGCREIELLADDRDEQVMITLHGELGAKDQETLAQDFLARLPGVMGVSIETAHNRRTVGSSALSYRVGDFKYQVSPGSFFQASRYLVPDLVSAVTDEESGSFALDLFAGVGLLTLPLARRFTEVIAVESHPQAAADLKANAQAHDLRNVRTVSEEAFDFLRRFARSCPDLVVLDPPRAGVGAATLELLTRLKPKRIHYVSCGPPTLARDLGYLVKQGYQLIDIALLDFFPQTYHLECLAKLTGSHLGGT